MAVLPITAAAAAFCTAPAKRRWMLLESIAIDLEDQGIGVLVLHPGWVKTDMGGANAWSTPRKALPACAGDCAVYSCQSGSFFKYDGSTLPWWQNHENRHTNLGVQRRYTTLLALAAGLAKSRTQRHAGCQQHRQQGLYGHLHRFKHPVSKIPRHINFDMQGFAQRTFRMNTLQWLRALLDEAFFPYEQTLYETAKQLVHDNDCVIGHHFLYPLKLAAIRQRKPHFTVTFCHAAIPSATQAPFPFPDLGVFLNNCRGKCWIGCSTGHSRKPLMRLWLEEGEAPVETFWPVFLLRKNSISRCRWVVLSI